MPVPVPVTQHTASHDLAALLNAADAELPDVVRAWRQHAASPATGDRKSYVQLANWFQKHAESLLAYDVTQHALRRHHSVKLRRIQALALAELGATQAANEVLRTLFAEGCNDLETMGLLARTYKDLKRFADAREIYAEAHARYNDIWTGINTATVSLLGNLEPAARIRDLAERVYRRCSRIANKRYWHLATMGEARLLSARWDSAAGWYTQANALLPLRRREIASTRRQARLIMDKLDCPAGDRAAVEACFPVPTVVVFSGHMIDQQDRPTPRFPAAMEHHVRRALRERLSRYQDIVGYSSAACGGDLLFLDALDKQGGEARIVLPYSPEEFVNDSVAFAGTRWRRRFARICAKAVETIVVSPRQAVSSGSVSYEYANLVLTGLAMLQARLLEAKLVPLAVWDGRSGDGPGGTADVVHRWRLLKQAWGANPGAGVQIQDCEIIDPRAAMQPATRRRSRPALQGKKAGARTASKAAQDMTRIMSVMFVDVEAFSRLTEEQMPAFVAKFLAPLGDMASQSDYRPLVKEPRGDGVCFYFEYTRSAGRFALELNHRMKQIAWEQCGLHRDFRVRIALHAGPMYQFTDPISGTLSFTGNHVTYAARIEPIAPPGEVCASREFAALASLSDTGFSFEYAGHVPLAKGYGAFPIYLLRAADGR